MPTSSTWEVAPCAAALLSHLIPTASSPSSAALAVDPRCRHDLNPSATARATAVAYAREESSSAMPAAPLPAKFVAAAGLGLFADASASLSSHSDCILLPCVSLAYASCDAGEPASLPPSGARSTSRGRSGNHGRTAATRSTAALDADGEHDAGHPGSCDGGAASLLSMRMLSARLLLIVDASDASPTVTGDRARQRR